MYERELSHARRYLQEHYGIGITRSTIRFEPAQSFARRYRRNARRGTIGIYRRESYEAIVDRDADDVLGTALHELYGHGLYYECSKAGIASCRGERLDAYGFGEPMDDIEGVALHFEDVLLRAIGRAGIRERGLAKEYRTYLWRAQRAVRNLTERGFLAQMGFPLHLTGDDAARIIGTAFPNTELAVATVDAQRTTLTALVVGDASLRFRGAWLDVVSATAHDLASLARERHPCLGRYRDAVCVVGEPRTWELVRGRIRDGVEDPPFRATNIEPTVEGYLKDLPYLR